MKAIRIISALVLTTPILVPSFVYENYLLAFELAWFGALATLVYSWLAK
jgi:hypothetical protein